MFIIYVSNTVTPSLLFLSPKVSGQHSQSPRVSVSEKTIKSHLSIGRYSETVLVHYKFALPSM